MMTRRSLWLLAAGLLVPVVLLALAHQRMPWKRAQLALAAMEDASGAARLAELERSTELADELRLREEAVEVALDGLRPRAEERRQLERDLFRLQRKERSAVRRWNRLDAHADGPVTREARRLARQEVEALRDTAAERQARLDELLSELYRAEAALAEAREPLDRLRRERARGRLDRLWRRVPYLALFAPSIRIRELRPASGPAPGGSAGPERCITCHVGMDPARADALPTLGAAPPPHRGEGGDRNEGGDWRHALLAPHPPVGPPGAIGTPGAIADDAHHPARLGCTACHGGDGRSTDFVRAGHRPRDAVDGWESAPEGADALPSDPAGRTSALGGLPTILDGRAAQASCLGCHGDQVLVPGAPLVNAGRQIADRLGCVRCHAPGTDPAGAPSGPSALSHGPGPPLVGLANRTTPGWVSRYLDDPRAWSPTAWMPDSWPSAEAASEDGGSEDERIEIQAIVAYLFPEPSPESAVSTRSATRSAPQRGDAERGAALAARLACRACHFLPGEARRGTGSTARSTLETQDLARRFGPSLVGLGAKLDPDWLHGWLLDPPTTPASEKGPRHPDFRLSPGEAADLGAFLLAEDSPRPAPESGPNGLRPFAENGPRRDALLYRRLEHTLPIEASRARVDALDDAERWHLLGHLTLEHRGCAACHALPEPVPAPAGPPLRQLARSPVLAGRVEGGWLDRAHAPAKTSSSPGSPTAWTAAAGLGDAEEEALLAYVRGLSMDPARSPAHSLASASSAAHPATTVIRHGCLGCHGLSAHGGLGPLEIAPGTVASVPSFDGLGAKIRSDWLFGYLRDPSRDRLRPHLGVRMPTFPLADTELNALVQSFAKEGGVDLFESPPEASRLASSYPSGDAEAPVSEAVAATVGRVVFAVLACDRCHLGSAEQNEVDVTLPAPDYRPAGRRLRARWVERFLLDPRSVEGAPDLPRSFPAGAHGQPDSAFLIGALDTPLFQVQRARLERLFTSPEALHAYLSDPEEMARALRAHLWSLEGPERR